MNKAASFFKAYGKIIIPAQLLFCGLCILLITCLEKQEREITFGEENLNSGYLSEGQACIDETSEYGGAFLEIHTEEFKRGWYKVRVIYETGYDDNGFWIQPENPAAGTMNVDVGDEIGTIVLKSQHNEKEAHIWLKKNTSLRIGVHYCGGSYLHIKQIEVRQVPNYTPVFLFLLLFVIADMELYGLAYLSREEARRRRYIAGGVIAIAAISSIPVMNSLLTLGFDWRFHLFRIQGIAEGLLGGQFPVKIMPNWWNEYGNGTSLFYGDIFLYFPAVMVLLNYRLQTALKAYIVAVNLLTSIAAYKSFKKICGEDKLALLGAGLYTWGIFRISLVYVFIAVGAYTAMAFLPLIIAGIYGIRERYGWLYLSLGLTGCIQSHILTCVMAAIFFVLFFVLGIKFILQKSVFRNLCKAGAATLLWNLWFILPFLNVYFGQYKFREMDNFTDNIQGAGKNPIGWIAAVRDSLQGSSDNFLLGQFIGLSLALGLLAALIILLRRREAVRQNEQIKSLVSAGYILSGMAAAALFMATEFFPYDAICNQNKILGQLIHTLQFPFRFLELSTVFAAAATVIGLTVYKKVVCSKRGYYCIIITLVFVSFLEISFYYHRILAENPNLSEICEYYAIPDVMGAEEYLPIGTETWFVEKDVIIPDGMVEVSAYEKQYTTIRLACKNAASQESYIDVPLFFYPCYKAKDVETGTSLALTYGENNRIRVMLPPNYEGTILLKVSERKLWRLAEVISLISILVSVYRIKLKRHFKGIKGKRELLNRQ